jgi:hypothetical protein
MPPDFFLAPLGERIKVRGLSHKITPHHPLNPAFSSTGEKVSAGRMRGRLLIFCSSLEERRLR